MAKGPYTDDKYQYRFNFINKVPHGVILVSKNIFTGEVKNVQAGDKGISNFSGAKAIVATWFPWLQTKYVSSLAQTVDYKEFSYLSSDRVTLFVDIACEVKIVDGAKYEFVSSSVNEQLKATIDEAVRRAIISNDASTILSKNFDLYSAIKPDLDRFKEEYGVEITKTKLQNIKLPDGVRKSYEQRLTTNADVERIKAVGEANAYAKKLDMKVDIAKKENESRIEVDQMKEFLNIVKNLSDDEKDFITKVSPAIFGKNTEFVYLYEDKVKKQSNK